MLTSQPILPLARKYASPCAAATALAILFISAGPAGSVQAHSALPHSKSAKVVPALFLIHGRDQRPGDRNNVQRTWFTGLDTGLQRADASKLFPRAQRTFYWYADLLENAPKGCEFEFGAEAARAAGWKAWTTARDAFLALATQAPDALQRKVIESFMSDTAKYLGNGTITCAVDDGLEAAWNTVPAGAPVIAVAHSMGSMIVYKNLMGVLRRTPHPVYLVTIGSMVAQPQVQRTLLGSLASFPAPVPQPVVWWRNLTNRGDLLSFNAVAAFASTVSAKRPIDVPVDTADADRHSATGYLETKEMGLALKEAWCRATTGGPTCVLK